jgi:hypothetical protein
MNSHDRSSGSTAALFESYQKIKDEAVTRQLDYYNGRVDSRRLAARATSVFVVVTSIFIIPLATSVLPESTAGISRAVVVTVASLALGLVSGLQGIFQWERVWRDYSTRIVQIQSADTLWKLEAQRARAIADPTLLDEQLYTATKTLLLTVDQAVLSEMESFFAKSKGDKEPQKEPNE